jgi:hypothetical protein
MDAVPLHMKFLDIINVQDVLCKIGICGILELYNKWLALNYTITLKK